MIQSTTDIAAPTHKSRILYVGRLAATDSSTFRRWALQRLGNDVTELDTNPYMFSGTGLVMNFRTRTLIGPVIGKLNADILAAAALHKPDIVWFDKALYVRARTVAELRARGIYTIHYNPDNPFGPRRDPGWRLFRAALPKYDLHAVPRVGNLDEYRRAGARDVCLMPFAYEPTIHFPPPDTWSDANRLYDAVFIGSPYDQRPAFLEELMFRHGIRVGIWGDDRWQTALSAEARSQLVRGGEMWNQDYRETMWRARICLSFVTRSNRDDIAHRSVEIAGCGGFLLAEDTPGHRELFKDGEEAVFFRSVEDCAGQIRRFLLNQASRDRIAKAGHRRAEQSGYGNDARIERILKHIRTGAA